MQLIPVEYLEYIVITQIAIQIFLLIEWIRFKVVKASDVRLLLNAISIVLGILPQTPETQNISRMLQKLLKAIQLGMKIENIDELLKG